MIRYQHRADVWSRDNYNNSNQWQRDYSQVTLQLIKLSWCDLFGLRTHLMWLPAALAHSLSAPFL